MRYRLYIQFKGENGRATMESSYLSQVNEFLSTCLDDTVNPDVDIHDTVLDVTVTYTGVPISKSSFLN